MKSVTLALLFGCFTVICLKNNALGVIEPISNKGQPDDLHFHGHKPHGEDHELNPTLNSFQKGFELRLNVTNLQVNCTKSPVLQVNGVSWTLELCNRASGTGQNESLVDMTLSPSIHETNAPLRWSCEANAVIELVSSDSSNGSATFNMTTRKFTSEDPRGYTFNTSINWNNFTRYYVNGGSDVRINLNIASSPLLRMPAVEQNSAKFRFILEEVSELGSDFTKKIRIRNIKWQVVAKRNHGSLGIYLYADENDMDINSAWKVTASIGILSLNDTTSSYRKNFTATFHRRMSISGFSQFISWNDLTNLRNKFIESDAVIFEAEIKVDERKLLWGID